MAIANVSLKCFLRDCLAFPLSIPLDRNTTWNAEQNCTEHALQLDKHCTGHDSAAPIYDEFDETHFFQRHPRKPKEFWRYHGIFGPQPQNRSGRCWPSETESAKSGGDVACNALTQRAESKISKWSCRLLNRWNCLSEQTNLRAPKFHTSRNPRLGMQN